MWKKLFFPKVTGLFIIGFFLFISTSATHAVLITWDGGGADNNWSTAANWSGDVVPTSADQVRFNGTSVKDSIVDAGFGGSVNGLIIDPGYTGTTTLARSLTSTNSYTQAAGTIDGAGQVLTLAANATISGGTFIASSQNTIFSSTVTISGGTFVHNNGTVTFNSSGTISCNNVTFNLVVFQNNSSRTVSSNCTLPLGNNPTVQNSIVIQGVVTGSGTLTMTTGTLSASSTSPISGFSGLLVPGLSVTNGTFSAPATTTVTGTFTLSNGTFTAPSGTLSLGGTITMSGGTFSHNNGTVRIYGTNTNTLTCNNVTFNLVQVVHTSGTKTIMENCTFPLGDNPAVTGNVTVRGQLSGTGTLTTSGTFTASSTNPISGFSALTASTFVLSAGTFTAPSTLTVSSNFTISGGTFNHNNGTVIFSGSTATIACNNATFNIVQINNSGTKTINSDCSLPLGNDPSISTSITLRGTLSGTGTLTTANTFTASSTNPISGFSTLTSNIFTLTAGTFTAPSTMNVAGGFTISGGTFNANGGTLIFNGSGSGTLSCNGATFNLVQFTHTGGTKTVGSNCTLPLGANPTIPISVSVQGTLSGSGTLSVTSGTFTASSTNPLSGFSGLLVPAFTQSNGTFTAPATTTVIGTFSLTAGTFNAPSTLTAITTFTISASAIFNAGSGTVIFSGGSSSTLTCNGATFNLVQFTHSGGIKTVGSTCTLPLGNNPSYTGGGEITVNGTLSGSGTFNSVSRFTLNTGGQLSGFSGLTTGSLTVSGTTLDLTSYNPVSVGGLAISSGGVLIAPTGEMSTAGNINFTGGTFTHNNGTFVLADDSDLDVTVRDDNNDFTFYNLKKIATASSTIQFSSNKTVTVLGDLMFNGVDSDNLLTLRAITLTNQWTLDVHGDVDISYLRVYGSIASSTPIDARGTHSVDGGNNLYWTFVAVPTSLVGTSDSNGESLTVTWGANGNDATTEYYAENVTTGTNSGWITDTFWTSSGLTCATEYTLSAKARGSDLAETAATTTTAITADCPQPSSSGSRGGSSKITLQSPEGGFKVAINDGAAVTKNRTVNLNFVYSDQISRMIISNKPDFSDAGQEAVKEKKEWDLCSSIGGFIKDSECPPGVYTVYVRFYSYWNQPSEVVQASITLEGKVGASLQPTIKTPQKPDTIPQDIKVGTSTVSNQVAVTYSLLGFTLDQTSSRAIAESKLHIKIIPVKKAQVVQTKIRFKTSEGNWVVSSFIISDENQDGVFEDKLPLPVTSGEYTIESTIFYNDGSSENIGNDVIIDPKGYVYQKHGLNKELRIAEAKVTLLRLDSETNEYVPWAAGTYGQTNPQITDSTGEYQFLVPKGTYKISVEASGIKKYESEPFDASDGDIIAHAIELPREFPVKAIALYGIGGIGILGLGFFVGRRFFRV